MRAFVIRAFENRASTASTTTIAVAAESLPPSQPSSAEPLGTPVEDGGTRNNPRGSQSNRGSRPVTTSRVGESRRASRSGATSRTVESRQESRAASSQEGIGGTAASIALSEEDDFNPSEPPPIHEAGAISPTVEQAVITWVLNLEMTSSFNLHDDVETAYALLPLPAVPAPDPKLLAIPDEKVRQLVRRPVVRQGERPPLRRIEILPWPVVPSRAPSRGDSDAPPGSAGAGSGGTGGLDGKMKDTENKAKIDTIKARTGELSATGASWGGALTAGSEPAGATRAASGALGEDGYRWVVSEDSERDLNGTSNAIDTSSRDTSTGPYAPARHSGEASGLTRDFETPKRKSSEGLGRSGIYTCKTSMPGTGETLVSHRNLTFAASYIESQASKMTALRSALLSSRRYRVGGETT